MYSPVPVEQFRGLRLLPEQGEAPGSVSMLNSDLSRDFTQIGSRGGMVRLATGTATYHHIHPVPTVYTAVGAVSQDPGLLCFRNTGSGLVYQLIELDATVGSATVAYGGASTRVSCTAGAWIPAVSEHGVVICARSGSSNETARRATSGGITSIAAWGSPRYAAVTPFDDRLVLGHFTTDASSPSGANGSPCAVFFSDPSDSGTFDSSNWIELDPGDGDEITGMAAWREMLFVIKRSTLYVFYGTSTDATGGAIFQYRTISLPSRARHSASYGGENIIAGSDGVYLLLGDGVYKTAGDTPQLISRDITPLFDGTGESGSLFPSSGDWKIGYASNRLYLSYQASSNYRTLVYDSVLGEWLLWDISVGSSAVPTNVAEFTDSNGLPKGYVAAGSKLWTFSKTATSDDGTAIVSSYQSGFDPLGSIGQRKTVRETSLEGVGSPTLAIFTDFGSSDANSATVTLGTSPATDAGVHRKSYQGRSFSYKLSASSGAWSVARLVWWLREVRPPGIR